MDKQYSAATPSAEYSIGDEILANLGIQSHSDEQSEEEDELDA